MSNKTRTPLLCLCFALLSHLASPPVCLANDLAARKAKQEADVWAQGQAVAQSVLLPVMVDSAFYITDFGASPKADAVRNAQAINNAIDAANAAGGGKVVVPYGQWLTGAITLKSHVNLFLESGATLLFSTNRNHYLPIVRTRWEGLDCYNLRPLIYANGATDIAITGEGTIDGQASNENWWYSCGSARFGWKEGMLRTDNKNDFTGRPLLGKMETEKVDVEKRRMGVIDALRPQLINFFECERCLIEGVTLRNSPFWVIHPCFVTNLTVRDVSVVSHGPNSDGCDPECSSNVLIDNCFFDTGDDCIAIKSGRNNDGRAIDRRSENIVVRNCTMRNGHGGVVIGSEITSGCRNVWVFDCNMDSPELERVIRIKTNTCRGGVVENVFVKNVNVGQCKEAVLKINLDYWPREVCDRSYPPIVRNVLLQNVVSQKSKYGVMTIGLPDLVNIQDIKLVDCKFNGVAEGNSIKGKVSGLSSTNLFINGEKVTF